MISRIGKCHSCKQVSRKDYTAFRVERVGSGMYRHDAKVWGREVALFDAAGAPMGVLFVLSSKDYRCPRCDQHTWSSKRIEGFRNDVKCDARCQGARGHSCDCSCGGENHGKGFLVCEAVAA